MRRQTVCKRLMRKTFSAFVLIASCCFANAQQDSVIKKAPSKFDQFNQKAERLFKILPAPIISYSPEAGNIFGLAKNNIVQLSKKDSISKPSKLSEVVT